MASKMMRYFQSRDTLPIGGYVVFVDSDGDLKVRAPDGGVVTLVTKAAGKRK